jgi:hypothetical protein
MILNVLIYRPTEDLSFVYVFTSTAPISTKFGVNEETFSGNVLNILKSGCLVEVSKMIFETPQKSCLFEKHSL